jgi:ribosome-associated protein
MRQAKFIIQGSLMLTITSTLQVPLREFEFSFSRSSGPGGQNVNKTSSKAELRWNVEQSPSIPDAVKRRFIEQNRTRINDLGVVLIKSDRFRDQGRNTADCLEKLRELLETASRIPKNRRPTKPTKASKLRTKSEKIYQKDKKRNRRVPSGGD